jgi:hypothetical protein
MQIRRDQNKESSDQVKEEPSHRQTNDIGDDGRQPPNWPAGRLNGSRSLLKAVRAEKSPFMLCDAFPAEVLGASRTAGSSFPIRMDETSLKSEVHELRTSHKGFKGHEGKSQLIIPSTLQPSCPSCEVVSGCVIRCSDSSGVPRRAAHPGSAARWWPFLCENRELFPTGRTDESELPFEAGRCRLGPG